MESMLNSMENVSYFQEPQYACILSWNIQQVNIVFHDKNNYILYIIL